MRHFFGVLVAAVCASVTVAQPFTFTATNLVVERFGGDANYNPGVALLNATATPIFIDQFLPSGLQVLPQTTAGANLSIALSTTVGTSGNPLATTAVGTSTSEGMFTRSVDGLSLIVPGYNAAPGTVVPSTPSVVSRSIAVITAGGINSSTGYNNATLGGTNPRAAASVDGTSFYISQNNPVGILPATGTIGTSTSIVGNNIRSIRILGNSLFGSSGSVTPGIGISLIGLPGTLPTGAVTATFLPGTGAGGTGATSPYGIQLFNNSLNPNTWNGTGFNTLYVADDRVAASGGGINRYVWDGTIWNFTAAIASGTTGARGLVATYDDVTHVTTLFATTAGSTTTSTNSVFTVTDTLTGVLSGTGAGAFSGLTLLATSPTNSQFRGIDFAPVPEPATVLGIAAAGFGVAGMIRRRFRKTVAA